MRFSISQAKPKFKLVGGKKAMCRGRRPRAKGLVRAGVVPTAPRSLKSRKSPAREMVPCEARHLKYLQYTCGVRVIAPLSTPSTLPAGGWLGAIYDSPRRSVLGFCCPCMPCLGTSDLHNRRQKKFRRLEKILTPIKPTKPIKSRTIKIYSNLKSP